MAKGGIGMELRRELTVSLTNRPVQLEPRRSFVRLVSLSAQNCSLLPRYPLVTSLVAGPSPRWQDAAMHLREATVRLDAANRSEDAMTQQEIAVLVNGVSRWKPRARLVARRHSRSPRTPQGPPMGG